MGQGKKAKRKRSRKGSNLRFIFRWYLFLVLVLIAACSPVSETDLPPTRSPVANVPDTETPSFSPTVPSPENILPRNSQAPSPTGMRITPSSTPCVDEEGMVERFAIPSPALDGDLEGRVYLPPCYPQERDEGYPVLYLLHGVTESDEQWDRLGVDEGMDGLLAEGEIPPFLIVMPREPSWGLPSNNPFGDALVQDLILWIDEHYHTRTDRKYRAIGGLSRGGNWALHIGSLEWELFAAVGAHSAPVFFGDGRDIPAWLSAIPDEKLPRIYLDIGEDDQNQSAIQDLEQALTRRGIPHEWYLYPGTHNDAYWREHVEDYLAWYGAGWMAEVEREWAPGNQGEIR